MSVMTVNIPFAPLWSLHSIYMTKMLNTYLWNLLLPLSDEYLEQLICNKREKLVDGRWHCKDCGQTSTRKTDINRHIEAKHLGPEAVVNCHLCGTICKNRHLLQRHLLAYHRWLRCNFRWIWIKNNLISSKCHIMVTP